MKEGRSELRNEKESSQLQENSPESWPWCFVARTSFDCPISWLILVDKSATCMYFPYSHNALKTGARFLRVQMNVVNVSF